jgi:hypothetical protein
MKRDLAMIVAPRTKRPCSLNESRALISRETTVWLTAHTPETEIQKGKGAGVSKD